jgi:ABC-type Fe3+ transport system permease subunit/sugar lactone lactonase YvrE
VNWLLLKNTLLVGAATTLLAILLGVAGALCAVCLPRRGRYLLLGLAGIAAVLPPFLVTNCWLHFFGYTGVWRQWLPLNIFSIGGTIWVLSLLLWPLPLLAAWSAWQRLEPAQLESDLAVSGKFLWAGLLWPLAKTALAQAGVLVFVLATNNFAVPAILQVKVSPAEMWIRFNTEFDTAGTLQLSWPLIITPLLLLLWLGRRGVPWPHRQPSVTAQRLRQQLGPVWFGTSSGVTLLVCSLSVGLPLVQLLSTARTWTELPGALAAGQSALWNSFWFATVGATAVVGLGLLGHSRRPSADGVFPSGVWSRLGALLWLPFLLPGVLVGLGLIAIFNRPGLTSFYQSFGIVGLAFLVRYLGFGWNSVARAWQAEDPNLLDSARVEGASRWQALRYVHWPQVGRALLVIWYIIFLLCLWDVESMILVVPPGGETVALRVFNLLHYGHNAQVNALCLTLLVLALIPLVGWGTARAVQNAWRQFRNSKGLPPAVTAAVSLLVLTGPLAFTGCTPASRETDRPLESRVFSRVKVVGHRGVGVGELNKPRSLVVDAKDNLYVTDMTGRVQKFSSNGVFLLSWQMPQTDLGRPKGMCVDRAGDIVVNEPHYSRVNYFTPTGQLLTQWGVRGTNDGQLMFPRAVAINSRDEIYVSEYGLVERVQRFTAEGRRLLNSFGHAGNGLGEFNRPEGLCIDAQDRVYVADSCNHRIQVFTSDGRFLRAYGKPGRGKGELSYPYDICVDSTGRQFVCEFGNSRIQVFDAKDQPLEIIGGPGAEPGFFSNPWSVTLDREENLYVADSQNHRVQKFLRKTTGVASSTERNSRPVSSAELALGSAFADLSATTPP